MGAPACSRSRWGGICPGLTCKCRTPPGQREREKDKARERERETEREGEREREREREREQWPMLKRVFVGVKFIYGLHYVNLGPQNQSSKGG